MIENMPASPRDRRREETRSEILSAAWDLCRENGLLGLSLRELAGRVGMRAPSLYSYFDSKEAIYDAMFAAGQRELLAVLAQLSKSHIDRSEFRRGFRLFFDFCVSDPLRYQLMFQRVVPGFVPTEGSYALATQVLDQLIGQMASVGVTDPRMIDLWTAMATGLTDQQISNDPGGNRWADLLDEAVELFCDHAGVPPTPARGGQDDPE